MNERDCEHGYQRGKCTQCDLREAQAEIERLQIQLDAANKYVAYMENSLRNDQWAQKASSLLAERDALQS